MRLVKILPRLLGPCQQVGYRLFLVLARIDKLNSGQAIPQYVGDGCVHWGKCSMFPANRYQEYRPSFKSASCTRHLKCRKGRQHCMHTCCTMLLRHRAYDCSTVLCTMLLERLSAPSVRWPQVATNSSFSYILERKRL